MMVDSFSELSGSHHHHASDPDAQQTLTDFIDYTEFFPSDLSRSLTLIGKLDERFQDDATKVHRLTKTYGALPTLPSEERPDPKTLRKDISSTLDHAIRAREASLAEASRLCNVADALYEKLVGIKAKLQAMPTPPSREPTPTKSSPVQNRNKKDKSQTIKLSGPVSSSGKDAAGVANGLPKIQKNRQRRVVVPGEPLPPYDPASPGADISSESESDRGMSPMDTIRVEPFGDSSRADRSHKKYRDKLMKMPRPYSTAGPFPKMRPRGVFGTNVHSQVAGISVSNAMASLTPPPENPPPGSEWAPWLELTDWELNILRRRMKKNANWTPSDTMKRRTLAEKNRGQAAYLQAKEEAEAKGEELLNEMPHRSGRLAEAIEPGGMEMILLSEQQENTINRGMKLNEQKKLKQARDMMVAAAAGNDHSSSPPLDSTDLEKFIADAGRNVAQAFQAMQQSSPPYSSKSPTGKKRKAMMEEPLPEAAADDDDDDFEESSPPPNKKQKLRNGGIAVPLAPEGSTASPPRRGRPRKMDASAANTPVAADSETVTAAPSPRSHAMQPPTTTKRPSSSRGASVLLTMKTTKAASAEPPSRRLNLRRSSNVSLPAQNEAAAATATGRRGRKPAPGFPKTGVEDANTVSSTKRKAKPGKPVEKNIPIDEIDPLEPRYCICGDVSWGDMVACENDNCQGGEWFHFECVGLEEQPPRRQKWYCPVCRSQLGVNVTGATMLLSKAKGR